MEPIEIESEPEVPTTPVYVDASRLTQESVDRIFTRLRAERAKKKP